MSLESLQMTELHRQRHNRSAIGLNSSKTKKKNNQTEDASKGQTHHPEIKQIVRVVLRARKKVLAVPVDIDRRDLAQGVGEGSDADS